ncbi:MAG TPA: molecular chaperone Hsp20 [Desulfonauticus sp.]|jgi:HSP20 family protein|nr:MAG: Heat shock protein Hsp20 [Desulfonauticus sp. 38_4375]MDK2922532.1 hypothetical protein [Desulfonauticus sp.]HCO12007.1 molecular chaperone Hsp20 [Desulfonauticus sp.]
MVIDLSTFYDMPRQLDKLLDTFFSPTTISQRKFAYPPVNLKEDEENIYVLAEIPGVDINDIELTITDGSLVIKGERKSEKGNYYRQERPNGLFQRIINLNIDIDKDNIKAKLKDGILEVVLPKAKESKPKKIAIEQN